MKPALTPLPTTPEHQAHRLRSRAAAMSQPRLLNAAQRVAERKDAIRRVLAHGPLKLSDIMQQTGSSEHAAKHTLAAMRDAGEIVWRGMKWERAT